MTDEEMISQLNCEIRGWKGKVEEAQRDRDKSRANAEYQKDLRAEDRQEVEAKRLIFWRELQRLHALADMLQISVSKTTILLHALGIQKRGKWSIGGWRNYFVASEESDTYKDCKDLQAKGWMEACSVREQTTFYVTGVGIAAIRLAGWEIVVRD